MFTSVTKRPVIVQACLLTAANLANVAKTIGANLRAGAPGDSAFIEISTLEGVLRATAGDVVIRGVKGEYYPCRHDIFTATYDLPEGGWVADEPSSEDNGDDLIDRARTKLDIDVTGDSPEVAADRTRNIFDFWIRGQGSAAQFETLTGQKLTTAPLSSLAAFILDEG